MNWPVIIPLLIIAAGFALAGHLNSNTPTGRSDRELLEWDRNRKKK